MATPKDEKIKVVVTSLDTEVNECFVGLNGEGYQIQCGVEVELPKPVIDVLKSTVQTKYIADKDEQGRVRGSKEVKEKRFVVEVA